MNETRWASRFSDFVPTYEPLLQVDRTKLPGWAERAEVESFESLIKDGEVHHTLRWPMTDGSTSSSPAQRHADSVSGGPAATLTNVAETLELPGTPSDYHFAIQNAAAVLDGAAGENPAFLNVVERLCWYDIHLGIAAPEGVTYERDGKQLWVHVLTLGTLVQLYEREGAIREALEVARIASESFDQLHDKVEKLTERLSIAEAEVP